MTSEASPSAAAGRESGSALMTRATFSRLASAWRATARFMRGRRDLVDRAAGVLYRHDRFRRVGHPEVGDPDTRDCQEGRVREAVIRKAGAVAPAGKDHR
jgi:hypothetical protein